MPDTNRDDEQQSKENDPMEEYIMLSQAAKEYKLNLGTLRNWVNDKKLPTKKELSDLGIYYHVVRRRDLETLLQNRSKVGRPLKRA